MQKNWGWASSQTSVPKCGPCKVMNIHIYSGKRSLRTYAVPLLHCLHVNKTHPPTQQEEYFNLPDLQSPSRLVEFVVMARPQQDAPKAVGFKHIQLFKAQSLGVGSYGAVCKAKCDDLVCAAKLLHPILFDPAARSKLPPEGEHKLPISRFEQECEFLGSIKHPNIVQYLGTYGAVSVP